MKITEKTIIKEFWKFSSSKIIIPNTKFFLDFESDIIMLKNDMIYEIEIKLSVSDYVNEFKNKSLKHNMYKERKDGTPNFFYFLMPKNMIQKEAIPNDYGLIEFDDKLIKNGIKKYKMISFHYTKKPKLLAKSKPTYKQLKSLMASLCWKLNK